MSQELNEAELQRLLHEEHRRLLQRKAQTEAEIQRVVVEHACLVPRNEELEEVLLHMMELYGVRELGKDVIALLK